MSRSKHAVELCALLVDETYGELTSRIFTILLRRGRLPIQTLCKHTRLTPRQVRHGLAVLIQQNLVYHNHDKGTSTTYYEANHNAAYGLVRSGKVMDIVESRYGEPAKEIIQNLYQLGHTKVEDFIEARKAADKRLNGDSNGHIATNGANGANGHSKQAMPSGHLHSVLVQLLEAGFIETVNESMFRSPADTYNMIEKELLQSDFQGSTKGNKQKDELKSKIQERMRQLRDEDREWRANNMKRAHFGDAYNGGGKRRKLTNGGVNGDIAYDDGARLPLHLTLRINHEKCTVALRNQRLVDLVEERIGKTTSLVYSELLQLIEDKIPRCRPDPNVDEVGDVGDGPAITTLEVTEALDESIDVGSGIGKMSADGSDLREEHGNDIYMNGTQNDSEGREVEDDDVRPFPAKRPRVTFQDKLPRSEDHEDNQSRPTQVKNHLQLLASDPCGFLKKGGNRGQGEWYVDYDRIIKSLQEAELDLMIYENFGRESHRLIRVMRKLGKLEEKQLPAIALMQQKDIRTKLSQLHMAGMVDIQEIPRDASRTVARTIYLWYFDHERVSAILVESLYKCMSRCFQRLDVERGKIHEVLTLLNRQDTKGKAPESFLEAGPLQKLREFEAMELRLLGQVGRIDEMIGIFRDY